MPNVYIPDATVTLVAETCYKCGVVFAMPFDLQRNRRQDQQAFYCPNGHGQSYSVSDLQRLKDELAREKHRTEQAQSDAKSLRERVALKDRQLSARKGQLTRLKNRAANGVCPCCNRYFANVHRHMTTQHPAYVAQAEPEAATPLPL